MQGDVIECQKCQSRFLDTRPLEEVEKKLCLFCDNSDINETIVLSDEQLEACGCQECKQILKFK